MNATIAQRLEDIDAALDSTALTEENFEDYYVSTEEGRGDDPVASIIRRFRRQKKRNFKILFSSYTGAGRSTELLRLKRELEADFLIIKFSVKDKSGYSHLSIPEIFLHIIIESLSFVVRNKEVIELSQGVKDILTSLAASISGKSVSASTTDILSGFKRVFSDLDVYEKFKHKAKDDFKYVLDTSKTCKDLILHINMQLHKVNKQKIVIIIDDLDKVQSGIADDIFYRYIKQFTSVPASFIYTFPMAFLLSPNYKSVINEFDANYFLPMIKVRNKDKTINNVGIQNMIDIIYKRIDKHLIPKELLVEFPYRSGGCLGDFFRLLKLAAENALDRGGNRLDEVDLEYSKNRLKNDYYNAISYNERTGLSAEDYYKILLECYQSEDKKPLDVKGLADLKLNNALLGYDTDTWFDVHPVVKKILIDKKLIEETPDELWEKVGSFYEILMEEEEHPSRELKTGMFYPPIILKSLILHNIKCFKHAELSFSSDRRKGSWTLLVGNNGVGKTTILHCIALCCLGPELASKIVSLPQNMLRIGETKGYMEAVFEVMVGYTEDDNIMEELVVRLNIEKGSRTFEVDINTIDAPLQRFIDSRKRTDFEGWFVAGYGAVRNLLFTEEPSKISQKDPVIDRLESLFDPTKLLIDPSSLYRFITGDASPFKEMGAPAKLNSQITRHITGLLDKLLPMPSFREPNGTGNLKTPFGKVPISELSEGYKSMLSWLAHLIMYLLAAVKWNGDINDIKGIVLIDEVDLHLHPAWQQKVIPWLRESFPNLQFIGCTHSPMTAGGADDGDIILLEQQEEEIVVKQDLPSIKGWRADQILTGPLFGLESSRDLTTRRLIDEYEKLIGKSKLSKEDEERLQYLESTLSELIPSSGETEVQREAFRLIEETMEAYFNKQTPEKKEQLLKEIKRQLKR